MKEELKALGITDGEIEVYTALLTLGPSTNSPIARIARLQSSTVYYCLNSLIEKGFVSFISRGNRRYFSALEPSMLPHILDQRMQSLKETRDAIVRIIPDLERKKKVLESRTTAEVHEGFSSFQNLFFEILHKLKKGDRYEAFVIEQAFEEPKEFRLLFMRHNRALHTKGITLRLLAPESMRTIFRKMYGKKFLRTYQQVRYTKQKIPVGITVYTDTVITHVFEAGKPISFKIQHRPLAQTYREYFEEAWTGARQ